MKKTLFTALTDISDDLLLESDQMAAEFQSPRQPRPILRILPALAAALGVVVVGTLLWRLVADRQLPPTDAVPPAQTGQSITEPPTTVTEERPVEVDVTDLYDQPELVDPEMDLSHIHLNDIEGFNETMPHWPSSPSEYTFERLKGDAIEDYFRKSLTPPYLPEDLSADPLSQRMSLVRTLEGELVSDEYQLTYKSGMRSLKLLASRLGHLTDVEFTEPHALRFSMVEGAAVRFGQKADDKLYYAEFVYDGIDYQLISEELPLNELVKTVSSIVGANPIDGIVRPKVRVMNEENLLVSYATAPTFREAYEKADVVALVKIVNWLGERQQSDEYPVPATYYDADIIELYRGLAPVRIKIRQDGSSKLTVDGYPLFDYGDEMLLFMNEDEGIYYLSGTLPSIYDVLRLDNGEAYLSDRQDVYSFWARTEHPGFEPVEVTEDLQKVYNRLEPIIKEHTWTFDRAYRLWDLERVMRELDEELNTDNVRNSFTVVVKCY